MISLVVDVVESLHHVGFRHFLFVNGHGDNTGLLLGGMAEAVRRLEDTRYIVGDFWDFNEFRDCLERHFGTRLGGHADACDASLMLYLQPHNTRAAAFLSEYTTSQYYASPDLTRAEFTNSGTINSDVRMATSEIGKELLDLSVRGYVQLLHDLESHGTSTTTGDTYHD